MATSFVRSNRSMKRTGSRRSHSWWWDSHISPKNSKWLAENLEVMDQSIKRMLKLIEEDGDSLAKKAEMYYQKRPELISQVEEFYRMYRSLADRYDHLTGELRKNIPSDLESQGSGISDYGSEPATPSPNHEKKVDHNISGNRAAGFEFFLGSGGRSSDLSQKEGRESSSSSDSEPESDDSSTNKYSGPQMNHYDEGLHGRIMELEDELRDVKEKLRMAEEKNSDGLMKVTENGNCEELLSRMTLYEKALLVANEKLQHSEEEIEGLKLELEKNGLSQTERTERIIKSQEAELESEKKQVPGLHKQVNELEDRKFEESVAELRITKERHQFLENEIAWLTHELERKDASEANHDSQVQLGSTLKDVATVELQLDAERKYSSELQERLEWYKTELLERDGEIRELKAAVSNADQIFSLEKSELQAEISSLSEERMMLQAKLKEWVSRCQLLEDEIKQVEAERMAMQSVHDARVKGLQDEIERLKADATDKGVLVEELNKRIDALNLKYDMLTAERDGLSAKIVSLNADLNSRDDRIQQMNDHLHQLHMEQVDLISRSEAGRKLVEELRLRVKELENEVEKQRTVILDGAEEKREAIRQLCFSLEHYRSGYHQLRQAFSGHKRPTVLVS